MRAKDLHNQRFGRLLVSRRVGRIIKANGSPVILWACVCDCGTEVEVLSSYLLGNKRRSCGCLQREKRAEGRVTHGKSGTKTHGVWAGMLSRCRNPNNQAFANYGGRGIGICDRWLEFENFLADMGEAPDGKTIERVDNDGDYCPENCIWATREEQSRNRRSTIWITANGETLNATEWSRKLGGADMLVARRLRDGWDPQDAVAVLPNNDPWKRLKGRSKKAHL